MKRIVGTSAGFLGLTLLALSLAPGTAAAVPVVAESVVTLPATDAMYILTCDIDEFNGVLYEVDAATGEASRVGAWENPQDSENDVFSCAGPAAYNPANGKGYWFSWALLTNYLIEVDLTTGENTLIGEVTLDGVPHDVLGLAIDADGNAWATSWRPDSGIDTLYSVNLATAELQVVGATGVLPADENYGLAWDSVTDTIYGYNSNNTNFYTVNTATGAFALYNDGVFTENTPYAMAFDSSGRVWGINGDVISAPLSNLDAFEHLVIINPYLDGTEQIYSESIIIAQVPADQPAPPLTPAPAPELAATGLSDSSALIAACAGVLLLGAGLVIARRRKVA
jgi:hypothetical protein